MERELSLLPPEPDTTNFETYCRSLMGQTLYDLCIRNYTMKQWGRDPDKLSASVAVNRVELRGDSYRVCSGTAIKGGPSAVTPTSWKLFWSPRRSTSDSRSPVPTWPRSHGPASLS